MSPSSGVSAHTSGMHASVNGCCCLRSQPASSQNQLDPTASTWGQQPSGTQRHCSQRQHRTLQVQRHSTAQHSRMSVNNHSCSYHASRLQYQHNDSLITTCLSKESTLAADIAWLKKYCLCSSWECAP